LRVNVPVLSTHRTSTPISAGGKLIDTFRGVRDSGPLPEGELDTITFEPGDGRGILVEGRFAKDGVVTAAVKGDEEPAAGG
jgi:hypothetical protein